MCALVHRALFVAVVLVAATGPALARGVGLVSGRVTDERGTPLVGATVRLSSPGILGTQLAVTDLEGRYKFRAVPGHYPLTLRAEASRRTPVEYVGHTARPDGSVAIDFKLREPGQHEILVLMESGVPYHQVALDGALTEMPGEITTLEVPDRGPEMVRRLTAQLEHRPSAVLAIGENAARLARRHIRDVPVVFCMVPAPDDSDLDTSNVCGVPLNGGFEAQLEHLRHVAPDLKRIGTVYDPHRMGQCVRDLREHAAAIGVELVAAHVHGEGDDSVSAALDELRGRDLDAFLMLMEPRFVDSRRFDEIARFAASENLILAVPDQSLVQPGKAFSFGPGFWDQGAYAGLLVRRILEGKAEPAGIGIDYPDLRSIARSITPIERMEPGDVLPAAAALPDEPVRDE
ncbi:MAG TPA: ABC transporter substrate binding protein [Candidatus Polarisedimenticolia bacterium]|nr:ABC transporter substrate binding protein [Candidatus Polarisedimenticolia bacterium]